MNELLQTRVFPYWQQGGMLLPVLAVVSCLIWWVFLRARWRLLGWMSWFERHGRPTGKMPPVLQRQAWEGPLASDLRLLRVLTAVAPLLGLLGTVGGMLQTFTAVAAGQGDTMARLAPGLSRALITTQFGLAVAIPGVFGIARLGRMRRQVEVRSVLAATMRGD